MNVELLKDSVTRAVLGTLIAVEKETGKGLSGNKLHKSISERERISPPTFYKHLERMKREGFINYSDTNRSGQKWDIRLADEVKFFLYYWSIITVRLSLRESITRLARLLGEFDAIKGDPVKKILFGHAYLHYVGTVIVADAPRVAFNSVANYLIDHPKANEALLVDMALMSWSGYYVLFLHFQVELIKNIMRAVKEEGPQKVLAIYNDPKLFKEYREHAIEVLLKPDPEKEERGYSELKEVLNHRLVNAVRSKDEKVEWEFAEEFVKNGYNIESFFR